MTPQTARGHVAPLGRTEEDTITEHMEEHLEDLDGVEEPVPLI